MSDGILLIAVVLFIAVTWTLIAIFHEHDRSCYP